MKKTLFFMIVLAVFATGCKKDKSTALNYNGSNPIEMVLREEYQIPTSSDYNITYTAINENPNIEVITVNENGLIYGKNVGSAKVKISNGHAEKTIDVNVSLFEEPTFEFGCGTGRIRDLYGSPYQYDYIDDTTLVYQYVASQGYSYACGEMDFFFNEGAYYEADIYIRPSVEYLLNKYLTENFNYHSTVGDTLDLYKYKHDTTIVCGKFDSHNPWNEFCLFYVRMNQNTTEKSVASFLNRHPRSSKLRY